MTIGVDQPQGRAEGLLRWQPVPFRRSNGFEVAWDPQHLSGNSFHARGYSPAPAPRSRFTLPISSRPPLPCIAFAGGAGSAPASASASTRHGACISESNREILMYAAAHGKPFAFLGALHILFGDRHGEHPFSLVDGKGAYASLATSARSLFPN
jgi:hypothetical protein